MLYQVLPVLRFVFAIPDIIGEIISALVFTYE